MSISTPSLKIFKEYERRRYATKPRALSNFMSTYGDDFTSGFDFMPYMWRRASTILLTFFVLLFIVYAVTWMTIRGGIDADSGRIALIISLSIYLVYWIASAVNWHHKKCGNVHRNRYKFRPWQRYSRQKIWITSKHRVNKMSLGEFYIRAYTFSTDDGLAVLPLDLTTDAEKIGYALERVRPDIVDAVLSDTDFEKWSDIVQQPDEYKLITILERHW